MLARLAKGFRLGTPRGGVLTGNQLSGDCLGVFSRFARAGLRRF